MSQTDMNVANASGAVVRADMNAHFDALVTNSSGATAPTTTFAFQWWADTSSGLLKQRNAANTAFIDIFILANGPTFDKKGSDIASASPLVITAGANYFDVTGTTGFAAMTVAADRFFTLQFDAALTMTHSAVNLNLPGAANITTAAGDRALFFSTGSNTVICIVYTRQDGTLVGSKFGNAFNGQDNELSRVNLKDYGEVTNAIGSTGGGTQDIDLELGNSVSATVDTSANTFTFSNPTATDELSGFTLTLTNGGSQTVTWPASVDWAGGTAPTLTAAGVDILTFYTIDGGTIFHGMIASADSK